MALAFPTPDDGRNIVVTADILPVKRLIALLLLVTPSPLLAGGYGFDPSMLADNKDVNIYFGSVRDGAGTLLPNTTVILDNSHNSSTYVGVTDAMGRYRLKLPRDIRPDQVSPRCSKRGYKLARFIKRTPPRGATTPVEIDFILGAAPR